MSTSGPDVVNKASHKKAKAILGATKFNKSYNQQHLLQKKIRPFFPYSMDSIALFSLLKAKAFEEESHRVGSHCKNSRQIQKTCALFC